MSSAFPSTSDASSFTSGSSFILSHSTTTKTAHLTMPADDGPACHLLRMPYEILRSVLAEVSASAALKGP